MTFRVKVSLFSFMLPLICSSICLAEPCDPEKILRSNVESYQSNTVVWLSYVSNLLRKSKSDSASSFGISYAGIGLSFSDAKSLYEFVTQGQNYQLSQQQSTSVLRSTLSPESVKAYMACLDSNRGVTILVPDAAINEEVFQIKVSWDPNYEAKPNKLKVSVVNGVLLGETDITISPTNILPIIIQRTDTTKSLFISATVDGKTDLVALPPFPNFGDYVSCKPAQPRVREPVVRVSLASVTER